MLGGEVWVVSVKHMRGLENKKFLQLKRGEELMKKKRDGTNLRPTNEPEEGKVDVVNEHGCRTGRFEVTI